MRLTYDSTVDTAYLELRATGPDDVLGPQLLLETHQKVDALVIADFTARDGVLVGLEFVTASKCLPASLLSLAEPAEGEHLLRRMAARLTGRLDMRRGEGSRGP